MELQIHMQRNMQMKMVLIFSALEEFIVENGVLIEYNGSGGDIVIPGNMGITSIGNTYFVIIKVLHL